MITIKKKDSIFTMRTYLDNKTRLWQLREDIDESRKEIAGLQKKIRQYQVHIRKAEKELQEVRDDARVQEINSGIGV